MISENIVDFNENAHLKKNATQIITTSEDEEKIHSIQKIRGK